jgi:hypothetical protein
LSGLGAGLLGIATIVTSSMVDVVYRDEFKGTTDGVAKALEDKAGLMFAFHSITTLGAILMVVFAAGLLRRLRRGAGDSIAPTVAFAGLLGTAVVSVLGAGLDTEIMMALATGDQTTVPDSTAALYNNWIGTIPWVWVLAGLAGVAVYATSRLGVVPRWIGLVGLIMGGLAMLLGISPLEYMAGPVAAVEPPMPADNTVERVGEAYSRGEFCLGAGKVDEAIAAFEEAVKIDPAFTEAWQNLAMLYEKKGNSKKAIEAFRRAKKVAATQ